MAIKGVEWFLKKLEGMAKKVSVHAEVQAGFPAGGKQQDGVSLAAIATYQEYGTPSAKFPIPARPFMRPAIKNNKSKWGAELGTQLKVHGYDAKKALEAVGHEMVADIQNAIKSVDKPLSPTTLMLRKMRSKDPNFKVTYTKVLEAQRLVEAKESYGGVNKKPLIDRGTMLGAVRHVVVDK